MNTFPNQEAQDESLLLKLSKKRANANKISVEKSKKKVTSTKETLRDLRFDGL